MKSNQSEISFHGRQFRFLYQSARVIKLQKLGKKLKMVDNKYTYNFMKEVHQKQERSFVMPRFVPDFKGKLF